MNAKPSTSRTVPVLAGLLLLSIAVFYFLGQDQAARNTEDEQEQKLIEQSNTYDVRLQTHCYECDVQHTNTTGGTDKINGVSFYWDTTFKVNGNQFIHLSAQNKDNSQKVSTEIYINERLIAEQNSTGPYQIAAVSCFTKLAAESVKP